MSDADATRARRGGTFNGTGKLIAAPTSRRADTDPVASGTSAGADGVTLNLVDVEIGQAAKTVLADLLSLNYVIDPTVTGAITIQTTRPVPLSTLTDIFDAVLRANGAAIVDDGSGVFKIVPASQVRRSMPSLRLPGETRRRHKLGVTHQVVPLRYVSVTEMERILRSVGPADAILYADQSRNLLILSGTRKELEASLEAIEIFDVDWMKGMSFALFPVQTSDPEAIAAELDTIFSTKAAGGENNIVRFIPNARLKSVLVISSRPAFLKKARVWIKRIDAAAQNGEPQLFVYNIQNRTADELAELLQQLFVTQDGGRINVTDAVAPRYEAAEITSEGDTSNGNGRVDSADPQRGANVVRRSAGFAAANGINVVADESNNALLIVATPNEYRRIRKMIEQIDGIRNQVLLEATIAEVTLKDELKFGLRWFFENGNSSFTFTDAASGAISSVFPGFSYFFSTSNVQVALNAISSVTDVNVVSSPSLMVMDNKTAVLQIGAQVPVATQSAVSVVDPDAPIVNSIEFRDTGVILSVTPRVNDSGRVILEIEQEVSNVLETTTSGIDSPTIQQRKIKTTVVVSDGETLTLGGLIQEQHDDRRGKVPIVGDIPLLGTLFRDKTDKEEKTELLILIRPSVVRDQEEARGVTAEFRRRIDVAIPEIKGGRKPAEDEARRILY